LDRGLSPDECLEGPLPNGGKLALRRHKARWFTVRREFNGRVRLTAVDLFSGCGGLTQGLKRAGFRVVGAVDNDPLSVETYTANHPEVCVLETDIRNLTVGSFKRKVGLRKGELDLLAGCPPCQGFSTLRTLNGAYGVEDPRNDLLIEFQRFVEGLRPKAVILENVPGLAKDRRFVEFRKWMERLGYLGDNRVLNAADYGVPQRRRRLIYLASLGKSISFAPSSPSRKTVRDAIGSLPRPGVSGDPVHDIPERRTEKVLELIKRIPKNGGSRSDLPDDEQLECHRKCNGFHDVYGRMAWDDQAPTITSGCFNPSKGRFLHPTQNRAITMREAALLQGFPRRYNFPIPQNKSAVALMIGNALPPPFVAAHARNIRARLLGGRNGD
jgi:DNA (cytosine-5)-methyltransferase 1